MGDQLVKHKFSGKQMNKRLMVGRSTSNHSWRVVVGLELRYAAAIL